MSAASDFEVCPTGTLECLDEKDLEIQQLKGLLAWVLGESDVKPVASSFFDDPKSARALSLFREELKRRAGREA